jgi:hypothetical protein
MSSPTATTVPAIQAEQVRCAGWRIKTLTLHDVGDIHADGCRFDQSSPVPGEGTEQFPGISTS